MNIRPGVPVMPFPEQLARRYFRDLVLGLEYRKFDNNQQYCSHCLVHHMQVIHRDIKPENVLLNALNHAVIGDFSISYSDEITSGTRCSGNSMLTPVFTPPEMIQVAAGAKPEFNAATDIWALGMTLYCFLHGNVPYDSGASIEALYNDILHQPIESRMSAKLSPELRDLIRKLLDKNPHTRVTISEIKEHPWVTRDGADEMPCTESNTVHLLGGFAKGPLTEMSDEELTGAIRPAVTLVQRLKINLKMMTKKQRSSMPNVL